ncbi:MAG: hypothetical protein K2P51_00730 [Rhabdochlamydiaceae bacterium]|nr:hypothetical protein [Rhabdochlamydiaceae bacterium]
MASGVTPSKNVSFTIPSDRKKAVKQGDEPSAAEVVPPRPASPFHLDLTTIIAAREGRITDVKYADKTSTSSSSSSSEVDGASDLILDETQNSSTRKRSNSLTERGSPKEPLADLSSSSGSLSARTSRECSTSDAQLLPSPSLQVLYDPSSRNKSPRSPLSPSSRLTKLARERLPQLSYVRNQGEGFNPNRVAQEIIDEYQNPSRNPKDRKAVLQICHSFIRSNPKHLAGIFNSLFYLPRGIEFIYDFLVKFRQDTLFVVKEIIDRRLDDRDISAGLTLLTQLDSRYEGVQPLFPQKGISFSFAYEFTQALIGLDIENLIQSIHGFSDVCKKGKDSFLIKNILSLIFSMEMSLEVKQMLEVRRNFFQQKLSSKSLDNAAIAIECEQMVSKFLYESVLIPVISNLATDKIKNSIFKDVSTLLGSFAHCKRPNKPAHLSKIYDVFLAQHRSFISQISEFQSLVEEDKPLLCSSQCSSSTSSSHTSSPKRRVKGLRRSIQSLRSSRKEPTESSSSSSSSSDTIQINPLHQKVKTKLLWTIANPEIEFDAESVSKLLIHNYKKGGVAHRVIDPLLKQIWRLIQKEGNVELKARLESRVDELFGALIFEPDVYAFLSSSLHRNPNIENANLFANAAVNAIKTRAIAFNQVLLVYSRVTEQALLTSTTPETLLRENNLASCLYKALLMHYGNEAFSNFINLVLEHYWEAKKSQTVEPREVFESFVTQAMTSLYGICIPDEVKRILATQYMLGFQHIQSLRPEMDCEEIQTKANLFVGGELFLRLLNPLMIKESQNERWIMDFAIILQKLTNNTPFSESSTQIAFPEVCSTMYMRYSQNHLSFLDGLCHLEIPKPPAE